MKIKGLREKIRNTKLKIKMARMTVEKAKEQFPDKEKEFVNLIPEIQEEIEKCEKELIKNGYNYNLEKRISVMNEIIDYITKYAEGGAKKPYYALKVARLARKLKRYE